MSEGGLTPSLGFYQTAKKLSKNVPIHILIRPRGDTVIFVVGFLEYPNKFWENIFFTRKYPLRGYILGVLTHTTAWDRHWGGDKTLKLVLVYVA